MKRRRDLEHWPNKRRQTGSVRSRRLRQRELELKKKRRKQGKKLRNKKD